jgi:LytS/YehU family sensor histidine kinase
MVIQPYIENAIWHGLMHSDKRGHLSVGFSLHEGLLQCVIDDNGIGRIRSGQLKKKNILAHTSMGMEVTAQRIQTLGNIARAESGVEVFDKQDENGKPAGTRIVLLIPYNY